MLNEASHLPTFILMEVPKTSTLESQLLNRLRSKEVLWSESETSVDPKGTRVNLIRKEIICFEEEFQEGVAQRSLA